MTVKTRAEIKAENASDFPDNSTRLISPADLRGQMNDIIDSALFPEDDIEGPPGPPGSGAMGLYDPQLSGAVGDGTTNDRDALLAADGIADSVDNYLFINKVYKIDSDLTLTSGVTFGPAGKLKPASGVTVTLAGGFSAIPTRHVFDISLGGNVWATKECAITARNYGAVGNGIVNDRVAFQALIDCCLYFQKAQACHLDAGDFFISGGPLIVNYGETYRTIDIIGAALRYGTGGNHCGTYLTTDWLGALLEIQGTRGGKIEGISFLGPFYSQWTGNNFGVAVPTLDPYDHQNWLSPAGRAAGSLLRFKMSSAIHVDPRCKVRPVAVEKTAVRLVVTTLLDAASYENGDTVQGVVLATGDRILQAVSIDIDGWPGLPTNGVYAVQASGAPVRATDLDADAEFPNASVTCTAGDSAGTQWVCNNHSVTVGTTSIDFRQFDGTLTYPDYSYPAWTGIATQYEKSSSSAMTVKHCIFRGFGTAFAVQGCDSAGQADYMRMEYCGGQYCVYFFAWGNNQGRMQGTIACQFSVSRCHVSTSVVGQQNGKAHFTALNSEFANAVDILDIPNMSVTGGVLLENGYCEAGNRIGRVFTTSTSTGGFKIGGGHYGLTHEYYKRVPRYIIDCRNTGVILSPTVVFGFMASPLIIVSYPRLCHIEAKVATPIWMTGAPTPATIERGEAIMLHSTMGVLFIDSAGRRQGPWTGGGLNDVWSVTTGGSRINRVYSRHALSSVTTPIPFCAFTAGPGDEPVAEAFPVALGAVGTSKPLGNPGHFTGAPSQTGRTLTLVLASVPSLSNAQNLGYVPGSVISDVTTGNLFVITALSGATITAKALNNYDYVTGNALWSSAAPNNLDFFPTGHYTPDAGLEMTYTSASAAVTFQRADGTTSDNAQLPVGAAKMVNNTTDAMTPVLRANSAITASAAGSLTLAGNARRSTTERAGIWFVPRP